METAFFEIFSSTDSTQRISASNDERVTVSKHRDWSMLCACVRVDKAGLSFQYTVMLYTAPCLGA